jgi:hypothetical protein
VGHICALQVTCVVSTLFCSETDLHNLSAWGVRFALISPIYTIWCRDIIHSLPVGILKIPVGSAIKFIYEWIEKNEGLIIIVAEHF